MRPSFAALLFLSACSSSGAHPWPPPSEKDDGSLKMPPLAPHNGVVSVRIEGDDVTLGAAFGIDELRCFPTIHEGACASELCVRDGRSFEIVPDAGVIDVATPDGGKHRLVPDQMFYESLDVRTPPPPARSMFSFAAHGSDVPPFAVDVEAPPALAAVSLPGADPRSPSIDLVIAHEPIDAPFELVMKREVGPRVHCSFTGGEAIVPRRVLATLERGSTIRASAFGYSERLVQVDDFTILAVVVRDRKDFDFALTPAEASSDP